MPATKGSNISCSSHRTSRKAASIAAQNATCPRKLTWHLRLRAWHRAGRLLHLSPRAGRGRFASGALAKRSKSGEGALPQAQTRGQAPSPGFLRSASLRLESDLSPHAGRGGASDLAASLREATSSALAPCPTPTPLRPSRNRVASRATPAPASRE